MNPTPTELQEQINLFKIITMYETRYPQLKMISASMNGMHSKPRHVKNQKLAGLKPGYPDVLGIAAENAINYPVASLRIQRNRMRQQGLYEKATQYTTRVRAVR